MMHHLFQLFVALIMSLLATPLCAATQLPGEKIPRIGYLLDGSPGDACRAFSVFPAVAPRPTWMAQTPS